VHQIWVSPSKRAVSAICRPNLAKERLQIDTGLLLIKRSTDDDLYGGTNIDGFEIKKK